MTQAVSVRREGDTYQARMFWRYAVQMLNPLSNIQQVGFEYGPKSFDDLWIEYIGYRSSHRPTRVSPSCANMFSANGTSLRVNTDTVT